VRSDDSKPAGRNGGKEYNGKLKIDLPFDEAIRAALEVKPNEKPPPKPRAKKPAKPK
jgi:hypothetical protein